MKNAFKTSNSSRFNSLKEDNSNKWERERENEKERKRDKDFTNNYHPRTNSNNFKISSIKKPKTFVLDESSFPSIGNIITKQPDLVLDVNMDYLNKTKIDTLVNVESSLENDEIPEGIVLLKYENGKIIWKNRSKTECEIVENDYERNNKIINKLVENYENYKQNFDELWGEGEYDKIYKSENHDYEYFDRLDEEDEYLNVTIDYDDKEVSDYY